MIAEERRRKLIEIITEKGNVSVDELSSVLEVSRMTIQRDLDRLAADGLARKMRGGAGPVLRQPEAKVVPHFDTRQFANAEGKAAIARHLLQIIQGAASIAMDDSTTIYALSQVLPPVPSGAERLIFTNGLPLFNELQRRNLGGRVVLSGGEPLPTGGALVGPLAIKAIEGMRFDVLLMSSAGWMVDSGEVQEVRPELAAFKLAILSRARKKVIALDRNKINFMGPYPLGRVQDFDVLVTEDGPRDPRAKN